MKLEIIKDFEKSHPELFFRGKRKKIVSWISLRLKLNYWICFFKIYRNVTGWNSNDFNNIFLLSEVRKNSLKKEKVLNVGSVGLFLEHLKGMEASKRMVYNNLFNLYPSMLHLNYRKELIYKKIDEQSNSFVDNYISENQFMIDLSLAYETRLYKNHHELEKSLDKLKETLLEIKTLEPNIISLLISKKYPVERMLFIQNYVLSEDEFEALFLLEQELAKKVEKIENSNLINTWQYQTIQKMTKKIEKKELENMWKENFDETDMRCFLHSVINILEDLYLIDVGLFNEKDVVLWVKILSSLEKIYYFDRFLVEKISNTEWSYITQVDFEISKGLKDLMSKVLLSDELEQTIPKKQEQKDIIKKF